MTILRYVKKLRRKASELHLETPSLFLSAPASVLARAYNGLGPDRFCAIVRWFLTSKNRCLEPAALIHDWEYDFIQNAFHEAKISSFARLESLVSEANVRFKHNALICVKDAFAWYIPMRYWFIAKVYLFDLCINLGGLKGVLEGVKNG